MKLKSFTHPGDVQMLYACLFILITPCAYDQRFIKIKSSFKSTEGRDALKGQKKKGGLFQRKMILRFAYTRPFFLT